MRSCCRSRDGFSEREKKKVRTNTFLKLSERVASFDVPCVVVKAAIAGDCCLLELVVFFPLCVFLAEVSPKRYNNVLCVRAYLWC